jgi:hypothetical protein
VSVRTSLMAAVATRLQAVTVANGYATGIGSSWRSWQAAPPKWDALPVLQAIDPTSAPGPVAYGKRRHALEVQVQVLLPGGTSLATLRAYAADLLAAVGTDPTWGGLAVATQPTAVSLDPGESENVSDGVSLTLEIAYETALWAM